jgi:multidrug efflux system membrane fusion protein
VKRARPDWPEKNYEMDQPVKSDASSARGNKHDHSSGTAVSKPKSRLRRFTGGAARIILPLVILGGSIGVFGYLQATKPQVARKPTVEQVYQISIVKARLETISPKLALYGTIVAGREVEMRPLVAGRVIKVGKNFAEGGLVEKGELLVQIDQFDYNSTLTERKAQLAEAKARLMELKSDLGSERELAKQDDEQLKLRERNVARRENLMKRGTGTEKSLDDSRLALNTQRQQISMRKKAIRSLQSKIIQQASAVTRAVVAEERAKRDLQDTKIKAPFAGFLHNISIAIGKRVGINDTLAKLTDAKRLEAEFQISDGQYDRLASSGSVIGRKANVLWKTRDKTFKFPAIIRRVSGSVSSEAGGVNLYAQLVGIEIKTLLRPGVFVQVSISDTSYKNVFRLPDDALEDGTKIYIVKKVAVKKKKNGGGSAMTPNTELRLVRRKVAIVGRVGNDVLVRGDLKAGERVVSRTFPEIGPGLKVSIP